MQEQYPQIELWIDTGNDEQNAAVKQMLDSLEVELVVKNTLQAAGITQPLMLTLLISDDDAIRDLNRQYRQQDKPTDVLSFPLLDKPLVDAPADQLWTATEADQEDEHKALEHLPATRDKSKLPAFVTPSELPTQLGDIVISWPTVVRQA